MEDRGLSGLWETNSQTTLFGEQPTPSSKPLTCLVNEERKTHISGPTNEEPVVLEIQPRGKLVSNSRSGEKGLQSLLGWVPPSPLHVILSRSLLGAILVLCPSPRW